MYTIFTLSYLQLRLTSIALYHQIQTILERNHGVM